MFNLSTHKSWAMGVVATTVAATALVFASPSHAQSRLTTFATFDTAANTPTGAFVYSDNGTTGTLNLVSASIPITFQYKVQNGYGASFTDIPATLRFTATTTGAPTVVGSQITQNLSNVTLSFTANNAVVDPNTQQAFRNLLSANFNSTDSGSVLSLRGDTATGSATLSVARNNAAGVVGYSSDFLDLGRANSRLYTSQQFSLSFSGVNNVAGATAGNPTGNGLTVSNGRIDPFTADGTGTFSSNPPPPTFNPVPATPGQVTMLIGLAMGGLQYGRVRFVRRGKKTAPKA